MEAAAPSVTNRTDEVEVSGFRRPERAWAFFFLLNDLIARSEVHATHAAQAATGPARHARLYFSGLASCSYSF